MCTANEGGTTEHLRLRPSEDGGFFCGRESVRTLLLTTAYWLAIKGRLLIWWVLRPKAMGVRALVVRTTAGGQQQVLLVRHRAGREPWGLPGGGVERNEQLDQSALREVREEAGCAARVEWLHGVFSHFQGNFSNHITVFVCAALSEVHSPQGSLEIARAEFFPLNELPQGLDKGSQARIAEYRRGEKGLFGAWFVK